jgi:glycosyltransferase involved in cell wall biosynthesis
VGQKDGQDLTISVVMATYQGERYLAEQLHSLVDQTRPPDELVVSDDGSTDGTWSILSDFADHAPFPVRLYRADEPGGWVENFFSALRRAEGSLVAPADQDDVWLPEKLERMGRQFSEPDVQLVVCGSLSTDEELQPIDPKRRTGIVSRALLAGPLLCPPGNCLLARGDLLKKLPSVDRPLSLSGPTQAHDEWLLFAARCFGRVVALREALVLYRRHGETVTSSRAEQPRRHWFDPPGLAELAHRVQVCRSRARFLERAADSNRDADSGDAVSLRAEAARYQRLEASLEQRMRIACASNSPERGAALLRTLLAGRYGWQRKGGLGWLALVQDLRRVRPG